MFAVFVAFKNDGNTWQWSQPMQASIYDMPTHFGLPKRECPVLLERR